MAHENDKKYITFVVMYDSYKGLTAANGAKYFSKKKTIQLIVTSKSFTYHLSLPGMEEMVMGILFSIMTNQKIIKQIGIKLIQEVLRKHYFQMLAMIQVQKK